MQAVTELYQCDRYFNFIMVYHSLLVNRIVLRLTADFVLHFFIRMQAIFS